MHKKNYNQHDLAHALVSVTISFIALWGLIEVKGLQLYYHTGSYRPSATLFYTFSSIAGNLPSFCE